MPDTAPETHATPEVPAEPAKRRSPGAINAKYLDEIALARELAAAAQLPEHAPHLERRGFTPAEAIAMEASASDLESAAMQAVGRTRARQLGTEEEANARHRLLEAIRPIRTGAKRKYRGEGNEAGRAAYFVNEATNISLERLLFIAGEMLRKLTTQPAPAGGAPLPPEDTLKGVLAEDLAELDAARTAYADADADQTGTGQEASALRAEVERLFGAVRELRIDLQLAADQAWPYTKPENAPARRAFNIPENRPAGE